MTQFTHWVLFDIAAVVVVVAAVVGYIAHHPITNHHLHKLQHQLSHRPQSIDWQVSCQLLLRRPASP